MPFTPLPTLRDIASRCGMARSTVGHILGGRGHLFKPETRNLVLSVAEELGWKKQEDWKAIGRGRFGCAVLLQSTVGVRSVISSHLIGHLEDRLLKRNMHLTLARLPDESISSETGLKRLLHQWSADGLIVHYTHALPSSLAERIDQLSLPAVWLNGSAEKDGFRPDDLQAGREAARWLLQLGHQRIAYTGYDLSADPDLHYSIHDRARGAAQAVKEAGGELQLIEVARSMSIKGCLELLRAENRPTAIICYGQVMLLPLLHAALHLGLSVPGDLSLLTFHYGNLWLLDRDVSCLLIPEAAIAEAAVDHLSARIAGGPTLPTMSMPYLVRPGETVSGPTSGTGRAVASRPRTKRRRPDA